ncbi:MAG: hypothetical protein ACI90A_000388 [Shewanella sp.]|jgi:hypothetical protein
MITFKYDLNQDVVELQASNWCGLEQVYINGQRVSRKLNFKQNSIHNVLLENGNSFKFQLLIDPLSEQVVCRIYKKNNLITSIKQGKENLKQSRKSLQNYAIFFTLSSLLLLLLN